MTNTDLIKTKLPTDLQEIATQYSIEDHFLEKMPELITLVLRSKSMDTKDEKQSWFSLMPMMTDDQIAKLNDILTREKQKLEEIEAKYAKKKDDIINKYTQKWDEAGYQNKIIQLKNQESIHEEQEDKEADALLQQL
jgi:hypothetical protein